MGAAALSQSRIFKSRHTCIATIAQGAGMSARSSQSSRFGRRLTMFSRSKLLKTLLFVSVLIAMACAASAAPSSDQSTQIAAGTIRTYLTPDLTLKSYFPELVQPSPSQGFRKTCRCSCGTGSCSTDADCGGAVGSCSHFISCCAKQPEAQMFQGSPEASRQTDAPVLNLNCK